MAQLLTEGREQLVNEFASTAFKLDQADIDALQTEPEKVVPKLFAKAHVESLTAVARIIETALPRMIANAFEARSAQSKSEEDFYGQYKDLEPHAARVKEAAMFLRKMNPDMPRKEFAPKVATYVRALLTAEGVQLAQPAAPANGNGNGTQPPPSGARVSSVPAHFAPATGSAPHVVAKPDEWADFNAMFDAELE